jgi:BMFP domain-containing protein YqiC
MAAPRILDDLAKTATGAAGVLQSAKQEIEALARARLERLLDKMELVTRDEFEAVKAMAAKAREENAALAARIAALEAAARKPEGKRR